MYGPQGDSNKHQFMQELRGLSSVCLGPWIIMGDFNLIYRDEDKALATLIGSLCTVSEGSSMISALKN